MGFLEQMARVDRAALEILGGVAVIYAPEVGEPVTVKGIFDENQIGIPNAGREVPSPAVFLRAEDLPEDPEGEDARPTLTINGKTYKPHEADGDDMGGVVLYLHEVQP
jgi:hypothetical protein